MGPLQCKKCNYFFSAAATFPGKEADEPVTTPDFGMSKD
jgi:hypothetical protein